MRNNGSCARTYAKVRRTAPYNKYRRPLENGPGRPYTKGYGDDPDSTLVTKPEVHAEMTANLVKSKLCLKIVANDDNYALAA